MNTGDTKNLAFKIKKSDGTYVDGSEYDEVEVQFNRQSAINSLRFLKSLGQVIWDNDRFYVFLTQKDTFALGDGMTEIQFRLMKNEEVKGTAILDIDVGRALSRMILVENE